MFIRFSLLIILLITCFNSIGQQRSTTEPTTVLGNVAYYFWEETCNHSIQPNSLKTPFKHNYFTSFHSKKQHTTTLIEQDELIKDVRAFLTQLPQKNKLHFWYPAPKKTPFLLIGQMDTTQHSVLFIKTSAGWQSRIEKQVLYFTVSATNDTVFQYTSDSVTTNFPRYHFRAFNHYRVFRTISTTGKVVAETILDYQNNKLEITNQSKRYLIFANGYRGPKKEKDPSDNLVTSTDRFTYWFQLDNRFVERLQPTSYYYIDGSLSLKTANYSNKLRFGWMLLHAYLFPKSKGGIRHLKRINKHPNISGFNTRYASGKIAGAAFLTLQDCKQKQDTVDIVCHSMGYAYSLGFIDAIKAHVIFGKMYILAPENSSVAQADWSLFQEVWQYGANLDHANPDPFYLQDGIAPQTAVKGIETLNPLRYGRIFTPANWPKKDIIDGHMIYSFDWIFDSIPPRSPGYIFRTF